MPRATRLRRLRGLEEVLRSPVLSYVTSTRENAEAQMGMDAIRFLYEHLRLVQPRVETLNLFIHSNGGDGIVPWKLVTLIREYCDRLRVLVPNRAFSAATLAALGADEIMIHPMGMLGPTDPSITGPYNPRDPSGNPLPISVEEVLAYFALVREDAGINHEDQVVDAVNKLADKVHPIALGSVKRTHGQSRMIAGKLMALGKPALDEHKVEEIVANLTSKLYYHGHPINRQEAKQIGLRIVECPTEVETAMWRLYEEYERDMDLLVPWQVAYALSALAVNPTVGQPVTVDVPKMYYVFIESRGRCDTFTIDHKVTGTIEATGAIKAQGVIVRMGWRTILG